MRFEEWLDTGEQTLLDAIDAYNEVDCLSTLELHRWLLDRRARRRSMFGVAIPWRPAAEPHETSPEASRGAGRGRSPRGTRSSAACPRSSPKRSEEQRARWLMAQLLHYHRREEKPVWWAYFNRLEMSREELVEDGEAIGELHRGPSEPPIADKRSFIYTLRFREQEHKLDSWR